jgi:L-fuculose-phosphate aldolase
VTPTGVNKGFLKPADVAIVDLSGTPVRGSAKPSSEVKVHLAAYRARPSCQAVVHAHPPTAVAFTIAGMSLAQCIVPESIVSLGAIPTAAYQTPSTEELARGVEALMALHDVVMMDRHGSVTLGQTVFEAYDRLESLEHTARITWLARSLGPLTPLPPAEIARLQAMSVAAGFTRGFGSCDGCTVCGTGGGKSGDAELVERVLALVNERLRP